MYYSESRAVMHSIQTLRHPSLILRIDPTSALLISHNFISGIQFVCVHTPEIKKHWLFSKYFARHHRTLDAEIQKPSESAQSGAMVCRTREPLPALQLRHVLLVLTSVNRQEIADLTLCCL